MRPGEQALEGGPRRFREARSVADVYHALLSVQRTLRDGHGRLAPNELPVLFGPAVVLNFDAVVRYAGPDGGGREYAVMWSGWTAAVLAGPIRQGAARPA